MLFSICMGKGKGFPPCHLAHRERRHMHACRYILYVRSINTYSISPTTVELTIRCRRQRNTEYIHVYTEIYNCCDSSTSCFALTCFAQSNASSSCIEPSCASTGGGGVASLSMVLLVALETGHDLLAFTPCGANRNFGCSAGGKRNWNPMLTPRTSSNNNRPRQAILTEVNQLMIPEQACWKPGIWTKQGCDKGGLISRYYSLLASQDLYLPRTRTCAPDSKRKSVRMCRCMLNICYPDAARAACISLS